MGSTAISYAGWPAVRFRPVAVTPSPWIPPHGGPYAVAIHAPDPTGKLVGDGAIEVQGGLPAPARSTTGASTIMNPTAGTSQISLVRLRHPDGTVTVTCRLPGADVGAPARRGRRGG